MMDWQQRCKDEIHFARPTSNASFSKICAMFVGAKFISPATLKRLTIKGFIIAKPSPALRSRSARKGESSARKKAKSRPSHRQVARSFRPERKLAFQLRQAAGDLSLPSFLSFARKKAQN
jgi:hypothetical protein